jgi:hypothetical protein
MLPGYRRGAYFGNLKLPADPAAAVGILKGKSDFRPWHSAIQSVLLSNPYSSELILGTWTEPRISATCTAEEQISLDEERREWHAANTGTCRFIRETLAANVIPFVRQYNSAKTLFFSLIWLYGEEAGIDTQGGPPAPINAKAMSAKTGRATLLAALDAQRTLDFLPPVGVTFRLPSPTTPTSTSTMSSSSNTGEAAIRDIDSTMRSDSTAEPMPELHPSLIRNLERTCFASDRNLETIHENEEPHPGRRIRISSGYAVDVKNSMRDDLSQRSISSLSLSDSGGEYQEVSLLTPRH